MSYNYYSLGQAVPARPNCPPIVSAALKGGWKMPNGKTMPPVAPNAPAFFKANRLFMEAMKIIQDSRCQDKAKVECYLSEMQKIFPAYANHLRNQRKYKDFQTKCLGGGACPPGQVRGTGPKLVSTDVMDAIRQEHTKLKKLADGLRKAALAADTRIAKTISRVHGGACQPVGTDFRNQYMPRTR